MLTAVTTPRLLTMAEAAVYLRCSRSHLSNLLKDRIACTPRLPCVRIGRRVLFRREALELWVREVELPRKNCGLKGHRDIVRVEPENSAGDAGKEHRASKAISIRLRSESEAWPAMDMDRKIPREWRREDQGSWTLRANDRGYGTGEIAGSPAAYQ